MNVEIIGGADAPSKIFLASQPNWALIALGVICLTVAIVTLCKLRKRK